MDEPRVILAATDFSPGSISAVAQAVRLSAATGAALHVVHATRHDRVAELRQLAPEAEGAIADHLRAEAEQRLGGLSLPEGVTIHTPVGKPVAEILALGERIGAGLFVLGATGSGGRRLGTVAGRCVRQSRTPVLLVPPGREGAFARVVASVDVTPGAEPVLGAAAWIARTDGASCTAVHVYEVPWERARWGGSPPDSAGMHDRMRDLLDHQLRALADRSCGGVACACELIDSGDYASAVIARARELGADLIVTGTTTRTALGYFVLGTTAEKLMRDSEVAVLAVHEP